MPVLGKKGSYLWRVLPYHFCYSFYLPTFNSNLLSHFVPGDDRFLTPANSYAITWNGHIGQSDASWRQGVCLQWKGVVALKGRVAVPAYIYMRVSSGLAPSTLTTYMSRLFPDFRLFEVRQQYFRYFQILLDESTFFGGNAPPFVVFFVFFPSPLSQSMTFPAISQDVGMHFARPTRTRRLGFHFH